MRSAVVVTVSDRCYRGEAEDGSGPAVAGILAGAGFELLPAELVPDDRDRIIDVLLGAVGAGASLVVTTGGTGLGPRDLTPQATRSILDYEVPGMAEEMRAAGVRQTPLAMLSRAVVGVRDRSLVINLPGSPRGARESLQALVPVLDHACEVLAGNTTHRAG